jgi:CRISPR system Cascade subunit CasE
MTYLSRIWLNPLRSGTQKLLRDPQAMHAAVLGGLSTQPVDERVLWRLKTVNPHRGELLVLTRTRPSWEHVVEQAGWPSAEEPQALVRDYQPLLDRLTRGQEYAFRVRANPVGSTRNPAAPSAAQKEYLASHERPRGVRVPHRTAAHQLTWFTDRIQSWGFTLLTTQAGDPQLQLAGRERVTFTKTGAGGARTRVVLQAVTYEGRIRVSDPDAARSSLLDGVGRARAYGFGLLTLAPTGTTAGG